MRKNKKEKKRKEKNKRNMRVSFHGQATAVLTICLSPLA